MAIKTFVAGERLFADDLNDNFSDLDGRTSDLDGRTSVIEGGIFISAVTQAQYDVIVTPDPNILYVIIP